jgi:hypothetical protein
MAAKKDFVPDSVKNLRDWAKNIVDKGPALLAGVEGWDAARIAAFLARVKKIQDAAQAMLDGKATLDALGGVLETLLEAELPEIRKDVGNLKKSRGWDDGKGDALEVNTPREPKPPVPPARKPSWLSPGSSPSISGACTPAVARRSSLGCKPSRPPAASPSRRDLTRERQQDITSAT